MRITLTPALLAAGLAQARIEPRPASGRGARSPLKFFLLVFALSIPLWLIGAVTDQQLMPGLPMSALAAFCPMVAALILVYRENKTAGALGEELGWSGYASDPLLDRWPALQASLLLGLVGAVLAVIVWRPRTQGTQARP